jgi:hypothetical protein
VACHTPHHYLIFVKIFISLRSIFQASKMFLGKNMVLIEKSVKFVDACLVKKQNFDISFFCFFLLLRL